MFESVVRNVRLLGRDGVFHIGINEGRFAAITKEEIEGMKEWEADGNLAFPPFVEMHTHLDTVLTSGHPRFNESGTLFEGIDIWQERKQRLTAEEMTTRCEEALNLLMKHGVLYLSLIHI